MKFADAGSCPMTVASEQPSNRTQDGAGSLSGSVQEGDYGTYARPSGQWHTELTQS